MDPIVSSQALHFRAPVPDDAPAVTALINERERADRGTAEVTLEVVSAHWSQPETELAADGLVAVARGCVVGYALATRDREFVAVAPAHEGAGIGSALLRWTMARSLARGAAGHRQIVGSRNPAAAALLYGAGYELVRSHHRMEMPLTDPLPHQLPDGISIRRIVRFLLAERRDHGQLGYVSLLGVSALWRGRGVGAALMSAAVRIWLVAGARCASLTVASDNPRARRLYSRLGMTVRHTVDEFVRPI